jgi:hypothetical protein
MKLQQHNKYLHSRVPILEENISVFQQKQNSIMPRAIAIVGARYYFPTHKFEIIPHLFD